MRIIIIILIIAALCGVGLHSCSSNDAIDGVKYSTYGIINESEMKNPNIRYEISTLSVVLAVVFSETIIVPIYIIGWDLFEPVGKVNPNWVKGQIK